MERNGSILMYYVYYIVCKYFNSILHMIVRIGVAFAGRGYNDERIS